MHFHPEMASCHLRIVNVGLRLEDPDIEVTENTTIVRLVMCLISHLGNYLNSIQHKKGKNTKTRSLKLIPIPRHASFIIQMTFHFQFVTKRKLAAA